MCVRPDGQETDAHVLSVLLEHLSQVHGQGFEDETEMLLVEEVAVQPQAVVLVVRISLVQPAKQFKLLQAFSTNTDD